MEYAIGLLIIAAFSSGPFVIGAVVTRLRAAMGADVGDDSTIATAFALLLPWIMFGLWLVHV